MPLPAVIRRANAEGLSELRVILSFASELAFKDVKAAEAARGSLSDYEKSVVDRNASVFQRIRLNPEAPFERYGGTSKAHAAQWFRESQLATLLWHANKNQDLREDGTVEAAEEKGVWLRRYRSRLVTLKDAWRKELSELVAAPQGEANPKGINAFPHTNAFPEHLIDDLNAAPAAGSKALIDAAEAAQGGGLIDKAELNPYYADLYVRMGVPYEGTEPGARTAEVFEIIHPSSLKKLLPGVDPNLQRRFMRAHSDVRAEFVRTIYTKGYEWQSQYFNFCCLHLTFLALQKTMDRKMRDTLTLEGLSNLDLRNLLRSYGLTFLDKAPASVQTDILRRMNRLINSKGTAEVYRTTLEVFGLQDAQVSSYYLGKDNGRLVFYRIDAEERDPIAALDAGRADAVPYASLTKDDPYWQAGEEELLSESFNLLKTKYVSVRSLLNLERAHAGLHLLDDFLRWRRAFKGESAAFEITADMLGSFNVTADIHAFVSAAKYVRDRMIKAYETNAEGKPVYGNIKAIDADGEDSEFWGFTDQPPHEFMLSKVFLKEYVSETAEPGLGEDLERRMGYWSKESLAKAPSLRIAARLMGRNVALKRRIEDDAANTEDPLRRRMLERDHRMLFVRRQPRINSLVVQEQVF